MIGSTYIEFRVLGVDFRSYKRLVHGITHFEMRTKGEYFFRPVSKSIFLKAYNIWERENK